MLNLSKNTIKAQWSLWLLAFLIFLNFQPYFVWHLGYTMYLITLPIIILCLSFMDKKIFSQPYFLLWIFTVFVGALCSRSNFFGIIMMMLIACSVFILRREIFYNVYRKLYLIYTITILISILMWIVVVVISVRVPYRIVEPLIALKEYNYIVYPFLVRVNTDSFNFENLSSIYRFCGLYDEPGVVGTISFLFLATERFNMKNRLNIVLLISGLLSLSLFFYLAVALYSVGLIFVNKKIGFNARIVVIAFLVGFGVYSYNNEILNALIWARVEGKETAQSFLDARASYDLQNYVSQTAFTYDWFWGVSDRSLVERFSSSSSIYNAIIAYGVITIVFYIFFFSVYSFQYSSTKMSALINIAVITLTLLQRPGLFIFYYLFLFRGLVLIPADTNNDNRHYYLCTR